MPIFDLDVYVTKVKSKECGVHCREVDTNDLYVLKQISTIKKGAIVIHREDFQCQVNSVHKYKTETHIINLCNSAFILLKSLSLQSINRLNTNCCYGGV